MDSRIDHQNAQEALQKSMANNLASYVTNSSPDQVENLLNAIRELSRNRVEVRKDSMVKASKICKKSDSRSARVKSSKDRVKRPLNSWMAFRAFYKSIFKSHQQKEISRFLRTLWEKDPFHGKWTILAKAYSIIRDYKAESKPDLVSFLSICCPHMGIVHPDEYFNKFGWGFDEEGSLICTNREGAHPFNDNLSATTTSVQDLLTLCFNAGFVNTDDRVILGGSSTLTMAMTTSEPKQQNMIISDGSHSTFSDNQGSDKVIGSDRPSESNCFGNMKQGIDPGCSTLSEENILSARHELENWFGVQEPNQYAHFAPAFQDDNFLSISNEDSYYAWDVCAYHSTEQNSFDENFHNREMPVDFEMSSSGSTIAFNNNIMQS